MNKTKTNNQKKVLAMACVTASVIVAGGTFAWYTSKEEVTNQLSAQNNYGVSIIEDFDPPASWIPGQEIEKNVAAVNTGNVDAFVRLALSNTMDLTRYKAENTYNASDVATYVELGALGSEVSQTTDSRTGAVTTTVDEVTPLQAGGVLAGAWDLSGSEIKSGGVSIVGTQGTSFDASTTGNGLYIFRRTINGTVDNTETSANENTRTYEYVGYIYSDGSYYKIELDEDSISYDADGYLKSEPTAYMVQTTTETIDGSSIVMTYVDATEDDAAYIKAYYIGADNLANTDDDITIDITLADEWDDDWTIDESTLTFYYNNILASGETTSNLVDSVKLDESVTADAFLSFDYNLKVSLDSIQVTAGNETTTAVNSLEDWATASEADGTVTWNVN